MGVTVKQLKYAGLVLWLVCGSYGLYYYITAGPTVAMIHEYIVSVGILAPIFYVVFYVLRAFVFFPASFATPLAAALFGPWWGWFFAFVGEMLSAAVTFWVGRFIGHDAVVRFFGHQKEHPMLERFNKEFAEEGFISVLMLRLIPLFPFDVVNVVCGISSVKFRAYIFATALGIIPGMTAYILLGGAAHDYRLAFWGMGTLALLTLCTIYLRKRMKKYA